MFTSFFCNKIFQLKKALQCDTFDLEEELQLTAGKFKMQCMRKYNTRRINWDVKARLSSSFSRAQSSINQPTKASNWIIIYPKNHHPLCLLEIQNCLFLQESGSCPFHMYFFIS